MSNENGQPKTYNIRRTAVALDISEQYVRQMITNEKLFAEKDEDGHWFVTQETIDQYLADHRGPRQVAYVVYLSDEDLSTLQAAYPHLTFEKRFDAQKAKEYRMKRAAGNTRVYKPGREVGISGAQ